MRQTRLPGRPPLLQGGIIRADVAPRTIPVDLRRARERERSTEPGQVGLFRRGVVTPVVVFPGPARLPGNRQNLNVIHLHRVGEQDLHIDASIGRQTRDQLVLVLDAGAVHPGLIQTLTDGLDLVSRKPL